MVDTRESLGEFESSIFDATDGHKLVDLIRRKKGLHVQTQKIFDDVPSHRSSLQIEIQRLDPQNETLRPHSPPQESAPAVFVNNENPPNIEYVPKSPVRTSVSRSITSPIIKMSSTTLGRRTLLKEFEKAFQHESRFLPEICSTPISSDIPNQVNNKNAKEPCTSERESPEENIICTPITISDEGSAAEQARSMENTISNKSYSDPNIMRSLITQNELLNAIVHQYQEEPDATLVNRDNLLNKSPRRTYTVERDISTGKITLSPSKSKQTTKQNPIKLTTKPNATPEQVNVFKRLGLMLPQTNKESPQKSSRIPILSKATTASVPPCLTTNQETTTAEFVERLQKNATPNCPVIVIPVNQTFNQAPTDRTLTNDIISQPNSSPLNEITSTISDNTPKVKHPSGQKETHREPTRVNSPLSNVISSTTISNGEQKGKGELPELQTGSLRWDDIITDDATSSDKSDCSARGSPVKNERRKISKKNKSQTKKNSTDKKKLSLSYKCLDLRLRVHSDEERENNLPHKHYQPSSKIDEQRHTEQTTTLPLRSNQGVSKVGKQCDEKRKYKLPQRYQFDEDNENDLLIRSRRRGNRIAEQCDVEQEQNVPHQSRRETFNVNEREQNGQQRSRRLTSKIDGNIQKLPHRSRRDASKVDEQHCEERENNLDQQSRRGNTNVHKQFDKDYENNFSRRARRGPSKIAVQSEEERTQYLPLSPRRKDSMYDEQSDEEREAAGATETDDHCEEEPEQNTRHRTRRETSQIAKQRKEVCTNNLPQQEDCGIHDQRSKERENNLPPTFRRETYNIVSQYVEEKAHNLPKRPQKGASACENQCDNEREYNFPERSEPESSDVDEQQSKQRGQNLPQRSRAKTSNIDKQRCEKHKQNLIQQSSQDSLEVDDQSCKEHENNLQLQPQQKTSHIVEQRQKALEHSLQNRTRRGVSQNDKQISQLRHTVHDNNSHVESFQQLTPPDQFRDRDSNFQHTDSMSIEKDLVDEISSDRIVLSQDTFKRPSAVIQKTKRIRKPKVIPANVKEYLDADKKLPKTKYLNVSKRKLYSKGNSDLDSSDDSFNSIKSKKNKSLNTKQRLSRHSRKFTRFSKSITSTNNDNREEQTAKDIYNRDSEPNSSQRQPSKTKNVPSKDDDCSSKPILFKTKRVSNTRKRVKRPSSNSSDNDTSSKQSNDHSVEVENDENDNETNVGQNIPVRSSRSTARTSNVGKNSKQTNKLDDVDSNLETDNIVQEKFTRSRLLMRRVSLGSSLENEKTSKQGNQLSTRKTRGTIENEKETNISSGGSRSCSPRNRSTAPSLNNEKNSRKTKDSHKDVESNLQEDNSVPPSKSLSYNQTNVTTPSSKNKMASKQSKAPPITSVGNGDVEKNAEKTMPAPPPKSRSKKKISKKTKEITPAIPCEDLASTATTSLEQPDCGPRRSKRERKTPSAYWACSDSQFSHVSDIYYMLTAGKKPYFPEYLMPKAKNKKDKILQPSTDDNLVVNTKTVDSSSKKNKNRTKQISKQTKKKVNEPQTTETIVLQSDSEETELRRPNVSSECPPTFSQLPEPSTTEKKTLKVPPVDKKSSSGVKSKSKRQTKKEQNIIANKNASEEDTNSGILTSSSSSNSLSSRDSHTIDNFVQSSRTNSKKNQPPSEIYPSPSEDEDISSVQKRRLTTISENEQMAFNQHRTTSINNLRSSGALMPPPNSNVVKKINKNSKKNTFHTEHDESIADVSSEHAINLFDQLKNSSMNNTIANRSRLANSSGQVSLDNRSSKKRYPNSVGKTKNVSVRLQRLNLQHEGPYDINEKHFDSGFSSEDMNSINTKKDILLDWLVQMLNNGRTPLDNQKGLARFLKPNGFSTAKADELKFEEIEGVDFAFYNSPGQKFGYLRFKPKTQKKLSCAKRYELNFVLLGGTIQMTVDRETFDMKNGDLTTIFIGTSYRMKNITDDPALVMVIRN